jgi:uncharacterized damage-inducible protein DinB
MNITTQLAKHLRDVHFGGNWTAVNLKDTLADVTWEQAGTQVYSFNTIATLVYHMNYYISAVIKVLQGEPLDAKDEHSFVHPPFQSQMEWDLLLARVWSEAEQFAALIERLPDSILAEDFTDNKYGTYYRNLQGIVEHMHYHLGQIVLIKKIIHAEA